MCSISSDEPFVPSFPSPLSSSMDRGISADELSALFDLVDPDLMAAGFVDEFASLFTSTSCSLSPSLNMKGDDKWSPLKPTTSANVQTSFTFDELNFDGDTALGFIDPNLNWHVKTENRLPLPVVTSAPRVPTTPPPTSKFSIPCVPLIPQEEHIQLSTAFFSRSVPDQPGLFVASQVQPQSRVVKRKRQTAADGDEVCATDGVLYNKLMEECNKRVRVPSLRADGMSGEVADDTQRMLMFKKHRSDAKLKLQMKKNMRKLNFNGHYPERKAVASSRKRVGGRFVKENKSVFRPVQQSTVTV